MSPRGYFITGSDTGVGKTRVGAALARLLTRRGARVCPRKPVESGCRAAEIGLIGADGLAYDHACGGREPLERINPYRLLAPLAPDRAAAIEGVHLHLRRLIAACGDGVGPGELLLVEGAGGFCSPLAADGLNADLAQALCLPVLLVSADRLGAIHHTLVTAEAIARRGLELAGVVLSQIAPPTDPRLDNAADIARWLGQRPILAPYHPGDGEAAWAALAHPLAPLADRLLTPTEPDDA